MARDRDNNAASSEAVISIVGPGMTVVGNCESDGTIRIEGTVNGSVKAGKAVVIGKQGHVSGDIMTQDAVISGRVDGKLVAASRLELQATSHIEGEVHTRRMQLEEGAVLNGSVHMGADVAKALSKPGNGATEELDLRASVPDPAGAAR
ncbi:MAG: polymer-forming cytoskeletal protein [Longimicrobiales bacterium]|nr:polymer-forming cytoskeletal protein [Longimicrobiales bacterium]